MQGQLFQTRMNGLAMHLYFEGAKVVKTTVLLKNMGDFVTVNEIYATYFTGEILPARAAFEVAALPKGALVEIEAIAEVE